MPHNKSSTHSHHLLLKGVSFGCVAYFLMALYGVFLKVAILKGGSTIWINFISFLTGAIVLLPLLCKRGISFLETHHFAYHCVRAFCGMCSTYFYIWSMSFIPLVNATLFLNIAPLFIPIFSIFLLHTKATLQDWLSILLGFIGVIIIIHPTADIFKQSGDFIGLASGISLALAYIYVKKLSQTDSKSLITFYFCLLASLFQLPFLFFQDRLPSLEILFWSICAGLLIVPIQFTLIAAYKRAAASKVGMFQYTTLIFVGIIDWLIWKAIPSLSDLAGMLLVVISGIILIWKTKPDQKTNTK